MEFNYKEELRISSLQYKYCTEQLEKILISLNHYENIQAIGSRKVGIYKFIKNLLPNFDVMLDLSKSDSIASFLTINRMIIDYYAVFYLIASHSTIKERNIRYYMYLIDGINTRSKTMINFEAKVSKKVHEYNKTERNSVLEKDRISVIQLFALIEKENLDNQISTMIIKQSNWKFIDAESSKSIRENSYSWVKLYNLAKIPDKYSASFQSYYSTFVHGLGTTLMSNSNYDKLPIICSSLYLTSIIQSFIIKIILIEYKEELTGYELNSDFEKYINLNWESWR